MTQRVRITIEGEPNNNQPVAGDAATVLSAPSTSPPWTVNGRIAAVEQITPHLTAEEALAEIEALAEQFVLTRADSRVEASAVLAIIARTKQPTKNLSGPLSDYVALLESAWGLIANAHGGNWATAPQDWSVAAKRWRDNYHAAIASASVSAAQDELVTTKAERNAAYEALRWIQYQVANDYPDIPASRRIKEWLLERIAKVPGIGEQK